MGRRRRLSPLAAAVLVALKLFLNLKPDAGPLKAEHFALAAAGLGTLFIIIFAVWLGWFPTKYDTTLVVTDWESFLKQLRQMAMPVMVLGLANAAAISRYMRSSMLENMSQDYVRTAQAKGLNQNTIMLRHVMRNALIPIIAVVVPMIPGIITGNNWVERIFAIPGMG